MATTIEGLRDAGTSAPDLAPPSLASPPEPVRPRATHASVPRGPVSMRWVVAVGVCWVVLFPLGIAIEPAPAEPDAAEGVLATVVALGFFLALGATVGGLALRRRWGLVASVVAAGILLGMAVACPATGHHAIAPWWLGQLAIAGTLVGVGRMALRRT